MNRDEKAEFIFKKIRVHLAMNFIFILITIACYSLLYRLLFRPFIVLIIERLSSATGLEFWGISISSVVIISIFIEVFLKNTKKYFALIRMIFVDMYVDLIKKGLQEIEINELLKNTKK